MSAQCSAGVARDVRVVLYEAPRFSRSVAGVLCVQTSSEWDFG